MLFNQLELRDIHVPTAPWWHIPTGYWLVLLGVIVGLVLCVLLVRFLARELGKHRQKNQPITANRLALAELDKIEEQYAASTDQAPDATITALTTLLRRVAVQQYGRDACAGLSGQAWVNFLQDLQGTNIAPLAKTAIAESQYRQSQHAEVQPLIDYLRDWLQHPMQQPMQQNISPPVQSASTPTSPTIPSTTEQPIT